MLIKAFFLGLLLVLTFIYAQHLYDRYLVKRIDTFLDNVKTKWYYWPLQVIPFIILVLGSGWFLTP